MFTAIPLSCLIAALPTLGAGGAPELGPGAVFTFPDAANVVTGTCDEPGAGQCAIIEDETPLRAYARCFVPLGRAAASILQYHEFTVPESGVTGAGSGSVLDAMVAGSVRVHGFLFTLGGASANAAVDLQLCDVTGDPEKPLLVWSRPVTAYGSNSTAGITIGASVNVEVQGGFPYVGASGGGGIGAEIGIEPDIQIIRDQIPFGFDLKLKRGRSYRLQLALSVSTHNRVLGGTSIASFYSSDAGGPVVPNVLNPNEGTQPGTENTVLSLLTKPRGGKPAVFRGRVGNYGLAKRDADMTCGTVLGATRNLWEQGLLDPWNRLHSDEESVQQRSDKYLAHVFGGSPGAPMTMSRLVDSDFMRVQNDDETETIDLPGVELTGLTVTVGNDDAELQQRVANRSLEENLKSGTTLASFCLPVAFGGELENVLALVDRHIQQFAAAGLDLNNAPFFQGLAHTAFQNGNYRTAYTRTRQAYQLLTRDP
jgi:hypothetical protein